MRRMLGSGKVGKGESACMHTWTLPEMCFFMSSR